MAADKEISADAALAGALSEMDGIFTLKKLKVFSQVFEPLKQESL